MSATSVISNGGRDSVSEFDRTVVVRHCNIEEGRLIEDKVFVDSGYGVMPAKWDASSNFLGAFHRQFGLVGTMRMISSAYEALPALSDLPTDERLRPLGARVCEFGAVAVPVIYQARLGQAVASALYVHGWSFAVESQCDDLFMVMEPRRAKAMNRWHGFNWQAVGRTVPYMGGDVASHHADTTAILLSLIAHDPDFGQRCIDVVTRLAPEQTLHRLGERLELTIALPS